LNPTEGRFEPGKQLQHVASPQLPPQDCLPSLINSVHLQDALRDIKPDHFDSHLRLLVGVTNRPPINASRGEPGLSTPSWMQDRYRQIDDCSCDARSDHT